MAIELIPLCTARITLDVPPPLELAGTPVGTRVPIEMTNIVYEGERLSGCLAGPSAVDYLLVGEGEVGAIDVRFILRTDDGALIHVSYRGRGDHSQGPGALPLYSAPLFETGDPRYAWLNVVQAVGKGIVVGDVIEYEIYEVR